MSRRFNDSTVLLLCAVLIPSCTADPANRASPDPLVVALSVQLTPGNDRSYPVFYVDVENVSNAAVRVIDLQSRPDLQHGYCPVKLDPVDRSFTFRVYFSDPGYLGEDAMIVLGPGKSVQFELSDQPIYYPDFVPGEYEAALNCSIDADRFENIYEPPAVLFTYGY